MRDRIIYSLIFILCFVKLGRTQMAGPAELVLKSVNPCPDPDKYVYSFDITRHKINRTHEAFDGVGSMKYPMDDKIGIYINVAKKAKDSYKPNAYEFKDDNACEFMMKWVGKAFQDILEAIGEPPTCPIKEGKYSVKNYLIDYRQIPQTLPYGDFRADIYLLKDQQKLSCVQAFLITKPKVLV